MKKKFLVIDFDGVICDSTYECLVVSYNAWQKYNNLEDRRFKISQFDKEYINIFKKLRPFVKGAGEYLVLFEIMKEDKINFSFDHYNSILTSIKDKLLTFKDIFLIERNILRKKNFEDWIALHIIYDDVLKFMKKFQIDNKLYIATLKDKKSICILLNSVNFKLNNNYILDSSQIQSKLDGLNIIRKSKNINIKDMFFIDDNIDHLIDPNKLGYKSYLANWCNPVSEFKAKANKNKINIINKIEESLNYV